MATGNELVDFLVWLSQEEYGSAESYLTPRQLELARDLFRKNYVERTENAVGAYWRVTKTGLNAISTWRTETIRKKLQEHGLSMFRQTPKGTFTGQVEGVGQCTVFPSKWGREGWNICYGGKFVNLNAPTARAAMEYTRDVLPGELAAAATRAS